MISVIVEEKLEELKKTINFYFEGITKPQASVRIVNDYGKEKQK